jgi:flagellar basal-body rod protein FlgF
MDNTLLINLSQQVAADRTMDVIANNLANLSTPAYRREEMQFQEYLANAQPAEGESGAHALSFVENAGVVRDMTPGHIDVTNSPFNFAVNGQGYFAVQTADGERYTRDGSFTLNAQGRLSTADGDAVEGEGGDITVTQDDGDIHVAKDGTVSGAKGQLGKIKLVSFDDERALVKEGSNDYSTTQLPKSASAATIEQGAIERSNVEPVVEISNMIEIMRAYQATTSLTESQEQLKRNAIDRLSQVQT